MEYKIKCDEYHVGHFCMDYMKKIPKDAIFQIDAATDESETAGSFLSRTIRLAKCFRKFGFVPGDVIALGGRNNLDVHVPFFAGMMNGLPVAGVDPTFKYSELKNLFKRIEPKIAFCQYEMFDDYRRALADLGMTTKIITLGGGDSTLEKFMEEYDDPEPEEQFKVATFDTENIYCWLLSTSGTTDFPKVVSIRHSLILRNFTFFSAEKADTNSERKPAMNLSSMQWISACYNVLAYPIQHIKLQTSAPITTEHVIDIINKYKPLVTLVTPTALAPILHHEKHCDLTCFNMIKLGGSRISNDLLTALRARIRKDTVIFQGYGMTEAGGAILAPTPDGPLGTLGRPFEDYQIKIVDPDSGKVIKDPHVTGELWAKGPMMAGYYNDPAATAAAFSPDGYYKTGDLVYRDENDYYFFVDRLKMLLKYKNYQVIPPELEEIIQTHDDVLAVCVTGVPHPDDGERVVACVVRRPGASVTAQEIKDLVANQLSAGKHLHGGVVFLDELPLTSTDKIARGKVKEIAIKAHKE